MSLHPALLALLVVLVSCGGEAHGEAPRSLAVAPLEAPGEAGFYPDLAAGPGGTLHALWTEEVSGSARPPGQRLHRLRTARFEEAAFGEPDTVAEGPGWFVNWADVPRIGVGPGGELAVTWLEKLGAGTYAYGIRCAVASDARSPWSAPGWLHFDRSQSEHGFASLAPLGQGRFAAIWLDGHATAGGEEDELGDGDGGHGGKGGHGRGAMALRGGVIEPDGSISAEFELDPRVCDCCPTALVRLDDGTLVAAYRDRGEDELRDISIVRSRASDPTAWSPPGAVHADGWRIAGCPVNGPALAARGREVLCAWFTLGSDDRPRVLVARSEDGGRTFGPPLRVDGGEPFGRAALVPLATGGWVVAWLEQTGPESAEWRARVLAGDGTAGEPVSFGRVAAGRPTGHAALAPSPAGALALWTDPDGLGLRAAELRLR